jgi:hypothetical protein
MDAMKDILREIIWPLVVILTGWIWRTDRKVAAVASAVAGIKESETARDAAIERMVGSIATLATQVGIIESHRANSEQTETAQWAKMDTISRDLTEVKCMVARIDGSIGQAVDRRKNGGYG